MAPSSGPSLVAAAATRAKVAPRHASLAAEVEERTVETIRSIVSVALYGEQNRRGNAATAAEADDAGDDPGILFDYFCEKGVPSLLSSLVTGRCDGVSRSPAVKAEALRALAALLRHVREATSLYYLLSGDAGLRRAVSVTTDGWDADALEEVFDPAYVYFLRAVASRVAGGGEEVEGADACAALLVEPDGSLPVLEAAVVTLRRTTERLVAVTAENVIVNLFSCSDGTVRKAVGSKASLEERRVLCGYLCQRIRKIFTRMATVTSLRGNEDAEDELVDAWEYWNDLAQCRVRTWNVRACEGIAGVLMLDVLPCLLPDDAQNLGLTENGDKRELGQRRNDAVAVLVFMQRLFSMIKYLPLLRLAAVALVHPLSPPLNVDERDTNSNRDEVPVIDDTYVHTLALHALISKDVNDPGATENGDNSLPHQQCDARPNPYRRRLMQLAVGCSYDGEDGDVLTVAAQNLLKAVGTALVMEPEKDDNKDSFGTMLRWEEVKCLLEKKDLNDA